MNFTNHLALMLIRIGIGVVFFVHGCIKVLGGMETWLFLGKSMSIFGITYLPLMWGLIAVANELLGGLCIAVGFATRLCAALLTAQMVVALTYHITKGDAFAVWSNALVCLIVFVALVIAGNGEFSSENSTQ